MTAALRLEGVAYRPDTPGNVFRLSPAKGKRDYREDTSASCTFHAGQTWPPILDTAAGLDQIQAQYDSVSEERYRQKRQDLRWSSL